MSLENNDYIVTVVVTVRPVGSGAAWRRSPHQKSTGEREREKEEKGGKKEERGERKRDEKRKERER